MGSQRGVSNWIAVKSFVHLHISNPLRLSCTQSATLSKPPLVSCCILDTLRGFVEKEIPL